MATIGKLSKAAMGELISTIFEAFCDRKKPIIGTDSNQLTNFEHEAISVLARYAWHEVPIEFWENNSDVVSWLDPLSFCYYLPSILSISVKGNYPMIPAACAVMYMLDRSPDRNLWDGHFQSRWTLLDCKELNAIRDWVEWLSKQTNLAFDDIALIRALLTIDLLIVF